MEREGAAAADNRVINLEETQAGGCDGKTDDGRDARRSLNKEKGRRDRRGQNSRKDLV